MIEIVFELENDEIMVVEKQSVGIIIFIYDKNDHKRDNPTNAFGINKDSFPTFQNFIELHENKHFDNFSFCEPENDVKLSFKTEYRPNDYPYLIICMNNKEYKIEKTPKNDILKALGILCF